MGGKSKQSWWSKRVKLILQVVVVVFIIYFMLHIQNLVQLNPNIEFPSYIVDEAKRVENIPKRVFDYPSREAIDVPKKGTKQDSANIDERFIQDDHNVQEIDAFSFITDNVEFLEVIQHAKSQGFEALEELSIQAPISSPLYGHVTDDKYICPTVIDESRNISHEPGIQYVRIPCGLEFGSVITITGKPRPAQLRYNPLIFKEGLVSQFMIEIQGSKTRNVGEDPPTMLHLNPRLQGDWSEEPVIEHNSRYGQYRWGKAHRCDGMEQDKKVDYLRSCEKWLKNKTALIISQLVKDSLLEKKYSNYEKERAQLSYPLIENCDFSLIIQAGIEGFHITIDGQHISSFPYQAGFSLEEATAIMVAGDVDVNSVTITSLPQDEMWKALPIPTGEVEIFVGVMSSTSHFGERMAIRRTWFQSNSVRSLHVVPRFFVALDKDKNINLQLKKEAEYYGDIIILPFIDRYDIVILKTFEIIKFGVQNISAKYIMKCDDDTFVRIDNILAELGNRDVPQGIYMGNMNEGFFPLRTGKWAVTEKEWPSSKKYPKYANGPAYIISKDFGQFVIESDENDMLKLFKMEDVTVGVWATEFANERYQIQYVNNKRMAQGHCSPNYLSIHYQSPRNMMCLWDKLLAAKDEKCCYK